jgi:hypothetical protein
VTARARFRAARQWQARVASSSDGMVREEGVDMTMSVYTPNEPVKHPARGGPCPFQPPANLARRGSLP